MASKIEICSAALVRIGHKSISSFEEPTDQASKCSALYPTAREELMRKHPWNCLKRRVRLSPSTTTVPFGNYKYFPLPADCLRVNSVSINNYFVDYAVEGRNLLVDGAVVDLIYNANMPEEAWDASLTDLMVDRMAAALAYPITKDKGLAELQMQVFAQNLRQAKALNGLETPPERFGTDSPIMEARF